MSFTTSFFVCLLLLMPGLTALAVWNFRGNRQTARRPELPLTAVNSLFVTMAVSLAVHVVSVLLVSLTLGAIGHFNLLNGPQLPALQNPYPAAVELLTARANVNHPLSDLYGLICLILFECAVVARMVASPGVNLISEGHDLRGVGWVDKHFLQPLRHDYSPIGFVMLKAADDGRGVGYSGPIDELRLQANGEVRSISLGQPQRFVYELIPGEKAGKIDGAKFGRSSRKDPEFEIFEAKWLGGVVHIAADNIETIVIHSHEVEVLEAEAGIQDETDIDVDASAVSESVSLSEDGSFEADSQDKADANG